MTWLNLILFTRSSWLIQKYLKNEIGNRNCYHRVLYDYQGGKYDSVLSGGGDERTKNLIDTRIDQLINTEPDGLLILIMYTVGGGGVMIALSGRRQSITRYWQESIYDFKNAFTDIVSWCKGEEKWMSFLVR